MTQTFRVLSPSSLATLPPHESPSHPQIHSIAVFPARGGGYLHRRVYVALGYQVAVSLW